MKVQQINIAKPIFLKPIYIGAMQDKKADGAKTFLPIPLSFKGYMVINDRKKNYIADPEEEIPAHLYSQHDIEIVKTDLFLQNIKKRYKNGYQNFANNAYREKGHFTWLVGEQEKILEKSRIKKENILSQELDVDCDEKFKSKFKEFYNKKIQDVNDEIAKNEANILKSQNQIIKAQGKYDLLFDLDNIGSKKQGMMEEQKGLSYQLEKVEKKIIYLDELLNLKHCEMKKSDEHFIKKLETLKIQNELDEQMLEQAKVKQSKKMEMMKEEIENLKNDKSQLSDEKNTIIDNLTQMDEDFAKIDEKLDESFEKVKQYYKKEYPHLEYITVYNYSSDQIYQRSFAY